MRLINHILAAVFVCTVTFTMAWPKTTAFGADPAFQVSAGERQLFLDDAGIERIEKLTRTMHPVSKKGAVIRPNLRLGVTSVQVRTVPVWDPQEKIYKLWDTAAAPPDLYAAGKPCSGYYESTDGLHWSQPALGQIEYDPWPQNNYISLVSSCSSASRSPWSTLRLESTLKPECRQLLSSSIRSSVIFSFFRRTRNSSSRKSPSSGAKSRSSGTAWKTPSRVKTPREVQL